MHPSLRSLPALAAGVGMFVATAAAAQQTAADTVAGARQHTQTVPVAAAAPKLGAVRVDGRLDEPAWERAAPVTELTQTDPREGTPASQRTEVRFLYDDDALYVGARMHESAGRAGIVTRLVRRDGDMESDWFQVVIDAYHDHLGRAFFQVNPSNVKYDALGVGGSNPDASWDPIWESATQIDSLGWTVEMRIPYSQLRFSRQEAQTWGLQIRRWIQRNQEQDQWSFWRKTDIGGPSRFGHLEGVRIASVPRHIEAVPYVVGRQRYVEAAAGDPFNPGRRGDTRIGGDIKALVTSNLTLNATINPDFGQVEVDPASINLSAFETFYDEKRPFFVADAGIFDFGYFNCYFCSNVSAVESFYSRRIGRQPQGADFAQARGEFTDIPETSTILAAAKLTGRTAGGLTVGLLDAVTRREMARVATSSASDPFLVEVEPPTNYFVGRVKRDFRDGNLVLGGIATSVLRRLDDDSLRARLNSRAQAVGADMIWEWSQKSYSLLATGEYATIHGAPSAIMRSQLSSARYYNRPDRAFAHGCFFSGCFDPSATSLAGAAANVRLAKDGGAFNWETSVNARTPGFEVNDISFLPWADYIWQSANVAYNWTTPTSWYRYLNVLVGGQQQWTWDGVQNDRQLQFSVGGQTPGFWSWSAFVLSRGQVYDERALRGGPIVTRPAQYTLSTQLRSDSRRRVVVSLTPQVQRNEEGGFLSSASINARVKAAPNVLVTLAPRYTLSTGLQQYVTAVNDPTNVAFYGKRYVMSSLTQKTLSFDTRLAVTFTPNTTLELFAQPFIASADYFDYKEFAAPRLGRKFIYGRERGVIAANVDSAGIERSYLIDPDGAGPASAFTIANRDFTYRALIGNAVFRWEYRPGSTLYFVWTQSRETESPLGDLDLGRDRAALLEAHPNSVFLVKASYWLGT